ncbi:DUF1223 domain-containing protein [Motiliproteus sediminis]|uniref:DUF1223 domain-containing protein n=1 Tax=Motiliproteus sediminis TaxID=1468178 RepID=UPI001AEFCBEE|nr:DUF1223 domain-containing protein [Motiliproteus sediminis]
MKGLVRWLVCIPLSLEVTEGRSEVWVQRGPPPQLIELFTSEGCSSCPPADTRLAGLLHDPELWRKRLPVAYHVDYWDYLGWRDPLADPQHAQRQRMLYRQGKLRSVYTPGWLVDGQEWRGFFRGQEWPPQPRRAGGELSVSVEQRQLQVRYQDRDNRALRAHAVLLGFDIESAVGAGENAGRLLRHQFVALQVLRADGQYQWRFDLQPPSGRREAVVVWGLATRQCTAVAGAGRVAGRSPALKRARARQHPAEGPFGIILMSLSS